MFPRRPVFVALALFSVVFSWSAGPVLPAQGAPIPPSVATEPRAAPALPSAPAQAAPAATTPRYVTAPPNFPAITVTVPAAGVAPGYVFVGTWTLPGSGYLLILDNSGEPVYYKRLLTTDSAYDVKVLPNGNLSYFDGLQNAFVLMDSSYAELGTVRTGNGQSRANLHDLALLSNGHYLLMADQYVTVDMSGLVPGGNPQAQVLQQILQEVDTAGNVYFEWPILSHVPITETTVPLTSPSIDYCHCNAFEVDADGNLLLSCRHLDAIYKINRATGQIMWHLGGAKNDFTFVLGNGLAGPVNFYHQHDIRRLPNGDISLFDNHNNHAPMYSRGLEYRLDEQNKIATLVAEFHASPDVYTYAMGNMQLLPNGNMFVGWGSNFTPSLTEFLPNGTKAFEVDFADPLVSYRAYRFPWVGHPTWPAALVVQPAAAGLQLTFSWNGATDVASYRIYGGNSVPPLQLLGEQPKAGFETSFGLSGPQAAYCYYQVVPVNGQGGAEQPSWLALNTVGGSPSCFTKSHFPIVGAP